ncbi:hypothetical protein BEWA_000460 [Theileria equi strain WA]|uniref:Uncharacterized protein n=1 Tax=Theileria equi strain WA TaxID=1537102 RepID=L0B054_THEEQ|nr:hypothetical protein BEWA_000460 [Theileria equi strain WA]AFZ80641.1 hypothetical protein BEWA_000460 [Theileria equi strain WA]|eukprot:XP_004830307.1 hypothetical protein BEWA_000460 [Theileria equi strain WA]
MESRQNIAKSEMKTTRGIESDFYGSDIHRQFNMLGEYLGRYEKVINDEHATTPCNPTTEPEESPFASTEGSFSDESVESLINEVEDFISKEEDSSAEEQEDTNTLLEKLQIAQDTIKELQMENEKASEDYFKMEQIMKQTYYEDLRRIKGELDEQKVSSLILVRW